MKDSVFIIKFNSTDKKKPDYIISCSFDKFSFLRVLKKLILVLQYYSFHDISFHVEIDCFKPNNFNNLTR